MKTKNLQEQNAFLVCLERVMPERHQVFSEINRLEIGSVEVVRAFDGRERLDLESSALFPFVGTIGCLISHLTIYLHCQSKNISRALIFEDDAMIDNLAQAKQALAAGESANVDICCYCAKSSDNRFLNAHAYSISLRAMRACLALIDSIAVFPINIHVDQLIEYARQRTGLSYRSLRQSSIVQNKELTFTTKWDHPESVTANEIAYIKQIIAENSYEVLRVLNPD